MTAGGPHLGRPLHTYPGTAPPRTFMSHPRHAPKRRPGRSPGAEGVTDGLQSRARRMANATARHRARSVALRRSRSLAKRQPAGMATTACFGRSAGAWWVPDPVPRRAASLEKQERPRPLSRTRSAEEGGPALLRRMRGGPLVGICEVCVESAGEQVQGTGKAEPLWGAHGVDVALEPFAPDGLRVPDARSVSLGRGEAVGVDLVQQLVEEPVKISREAAHIIQDDHLPWRAPAAPPAARRCASARDVRCAPRRARRRSCRAAASVDVRLTCVQTVRSA
jgi:hypothetical protein